MPGGITPSAGAVVMTAPALRFVGDDGGICWVFDPASDEAGFVGGALPQAADSFGILACGYC